MANKPQLNMIPGISYHPYSALIVYMDMREVSKDAGVEPLRMLMKNNDAWAKECARYRIGVVGNSIDWARANGDKRKLPDIAKLEQYLFNPACFIGFGNTDAIGIVLIDDFDPCIRLTSSLGVHIQQSCLAFCPKLDSLGLKSTKEDKRYFVELSDICKPGSKTEEHRVGEAPNNKTYQKIEEDLLKKSTLEAYRPGRWKECISEIDANVITPTLPAVKDKPLIAVTYYKLHSMAILGPGLIMQQAIYKTMADHIKLKLREMGEGNYEEIGVTGPVIDSFKCVFLDPQGWADIATIMFCRNYSVMISIVDALQNITFGELYNKEPALENAIKAFGIHRRFAGDQRDPMSKSHVFWSTYTTLGITYEAFNESCEKDTKRSYSGVVAAETKLSLYAGHRRLAQDVARGCYLATDDACEPLVNMYTWDVLGSDDSLYEDLVKEDRNSKNHTVVELYSFIKQIKDMLCHATNKKEKFTKHLLNFYSELRIPAIKDKNANPIDSIHMLFPQKLSEKVKKVFKPGGRFPTERLWDSARTLRIPTPLCNAIRYLYEDYATYVSDPFLFECVLDLYDIFVAVYLLITKELIDSLDKKSPPEQRTDSQCRSFLTEDDIKGLGEVVSLMREALDNRVHGAFPEAEKWSRAIDVQGCGLGRLIHTVDVPLRCWLSILRDVRSGWAHEAYNPSEEESNLFKEGEPPRIGGTSRISQDPRSQLSRITIGNIDNICLASVNLNFSHFTLPSAFCIYFHEVAHLICDKISELDNYWFQDLLANEMNRVFKKLNFTTEEQEEYVSAINESCCDIFPEMIVQQFVFDEYYDFVTYFRNYMANYSLDPKAHIQVENDARLRMFEMLMRGFLITDPHRVKNSKYSTEEDKLIYDRPATDESQINEITEHAFDRFYKSVRDAGPFYFDYYRLWPNANDEKLHDGIRQQFYQSYREMYPLICYMHSKAVALWKGICEGCGNKLGRNPPEYQKEVQQQIKEGLGKGQPLSRMLFEIPGRENTNEKYRFLSSTYLLNQIVKEYIKVLFDPEGIDFNELRVCLSRDPKDGYPYYASNESSNKRTRWHTQLIDRNGNRLFTVTPVAREAYMRSRIVVMKTLWDISTNIRARRMKDMLTMVKE